MKLNEAQVAGLAYVLILFIVFGGRIIEFIPERQRNCTTGWAVIRSQFVHGTTPKHVLIPPQSEWLDGQKRINKSGKCIRKNTAL